MTYQKYLNKNIKAPGIELIDKINSRFPVFKTKPWYIPFDEDRLAYEVELAIDDFRRRITVDGLYEYQYRTDKMYVFDEHVNGDQALHQGLALATAVLMKDWMLTDRLFQGSKKFIERGYLIRGFDYKGNANLKPPSLDQLAGLLFGWLMFDKICPTAYGTGEIKIIFKFLNNYIKDDFRLRDSKGKIAKSMYSHKSPFLINGDASVILAAAAFAEWLSPNDFKGLYDKLADRYGLKYLIEYGHIHFLWWIRWFSFNINMLSLATIYMIAHSYHSFMGMRRICQITDTWYIPFYRLLLSYATGRTLKDMEKERIKTGLSGYINTTYKVLQKEKRFLFWRWWQYPISPLCQNNTDWFPQRGNHNAFNNKNPDLWEKPYSLCFSRLDLIMQYYLWKEQGKLPL